MKVRREGNYKGVPYLIVVTSWEKDAVLESVQVENRPEAIVQFPASVFPSVDDAVAAGHAIAHEIIDDPALDPT